MKRIIIISIFVFFLAVSLSSMAAGSEKKSLAYFIEKEAVMQVVNDLFVGTDNRNWDLVRASFSEEVLFDMSSLTGQKPTKMQAKQIVAAWDKGLKALKAIHHQTGNFNVQINGDQATVFCYGTASHYLPNKSGRNTRVFVGSYDLHLTETRGKWRIDQFKFNFKYMDGNPNLEADL